MWYSKLNNKRLWKIFSEISSIPRESGNEEGIRNYLLSWAKERGIEASADEKGNVYMSKPGTKGLENLPPVALQAHVDMVCVKKDKVSHDFTKDPIKVKTDGTFIYADGTSLGADDGLGVATILDIFSDPDAKHGPIEGIFTVEEETGLGGAYAIDESKVKARRLINIDSEEEGIIYIGCAGGVDIDATMKLKYEKATGTALSVKVSGLCGGHSGGEIHKGRANAIKVLARYLDRLPAFQIASISGGTRRNVIPSTAEAVITVADKETALSQAKTLQEELTVEYAINDPGIKLTVEETEMPTVAIKAKKSQKIAGLLFTSPHGVRDMSLAIPGIVETSDNLAIVSICDDKITVVYSVRSNVDSRKNSLMSEILSLTAAFGFKAKAGSSYPAWTPDPHSKLAKEVTSAYKAITGKKAKVTAIHAGLECGIINSIISGMESVSLGPDLADVHSVNERADVASAERTAEFVKAMLPMLK
ncbi:MAG: aminoacyl-histidine dipeptidase [Spirochaetes bacterium]|uniref:Cytosol non-specific dipeptidase n=1 Tax=Candidatus Ornithospirochaeta stercoripullorum TaxID=2840899 RepID=A0A9D9E2K3_9SPIO|nr:aminoacyl-histidine dipeptidase [Candidatus Ornithospirochaeta stercoripullorum]